MVVNYDSDENFKVEFVINIWEKVVDSKNIKFLLDGIVNFKLWDYGVIGIKIFFFKSGVVSYIIVVLVSFFK